MNMNNNYNDDQFVTEFYRQLNEQLENAQRQLVVGDGIINQVKGALIAQMNELRETYNSHVRQLAALQQEKNRLTQAGHAESANQEESQQATVTKKEINLKLQTIQEILTQKDYQSQVRRENKLTSATDMHNLNNLKLMRG